MKPILVSGLINLETIVQLDGFPLEYAPMRLLTHRITSGPAGIGYNLSRALTTLGSSVRLVSMLGNDRAGAFLRQVLAADGISAEFVTSQLAETNLSVILCDPGGRRAFLADPKDVPGQVYPESLFFKALDGCALAALGLVSFSQPLIGLARGAGVPIACDLQTYTRLDDPYLQERLASSSILFVSGDGLELAPAEWARQALSMAKSGLEAIVIGLGEDGALLAVKESGLVQHFPAVFTRPVAGTVGAGDALFSAFIHFYAAGYPPAEALGRAQVFASYKIGENGSAQGFISAGEVNRLYTDLQARLSA